jgi:hypothetical protein
MRSSKNLLRDDEFLDKIRELYKWKEEHPEQAKILEYRTVFLLVMEAKRRERNRRAWSIGGLMAWTLLLFHVYMLT